MTLLKGRFGALLLLIGLLLLPALPAGAQDPVTDDDVNEVARDLYCPVCENTPLDVCPTQTCQDWRDEIRTQLRQGRSEEEIRQYFVERHGVQVLDAPPRRGFNLLAWLLPALAVAGGAFFFARYLRHISKPASANIPDDEGGRTGPDPRAPGDDEYISRVEKEIENR